jgi:hypothetical protein
MAMRSLWLRPVTKILLAVPSEAGFDSSVPQLM